MRKILVTGGSSFVSRSVAQYFALKGDEVYVLNRGTKKNPEKVRHIKCDRNRLGNMLRGMYFDAVLDVTAYKEQDVKSMLDALSVIGTYVLISSSAVYPETQRMPFKENTPTGKNLFWGDYGLQKIAAENYLRENFERHYIIRPPYLYGEGENIYRAPFVFDCALQDRVFVLPDSRMNLQFFYVGDLCRFLEILLREKPEERVFNVGNPETVSIKNWVTLCYEALGKTAEFSAMEKCHPIREYFCFNDYDYCLDVSRMQNLMPKVTPLEEGIRKEALWYRENVGSVLRKPYTEYIDKYILK